MYFSLENKNSKIDFRLSDENVAISIKLASDTIQSRFIDRFDAIRNLVDTPASSIQGFVVNTACANHQQIFEQEDQRVLFKNNNFWLFVDFDGNGGNGIPVCSMFISFKLQIRIGQMKILFSYSINS